MKQAQALDILKTGANVFLTGEPGSGKTYVVNQYIRYLREMKVSVAVTASTGIAATHLGGVTLHSWSGMGIKKRLTLQEIDRIATNQAVHRRIQKAKVLIIDEVSMLDGWMLEGVDAIAREVRQTDDPFGGLQVVLVGDFFQLPPVTKEGEGPARFAFAATVWDEMQPMVCYLDEQHRQEDQEFLEVLAALRQGEVSKQLRQRLDDRCKVAAGSSELTRLFSHNLDVDALNERYLNELPGDSKAYMMSSQGGKSLVGQLVRGCLSPERLRLKVGSVVMFTKNNPKEGYFNGTLGRVAEFADNGLPIVKMKSGRSLTVTPMEWTIENEGRVRASIAQIPLRLAWAITVHKSQGMSLDAAEVDLRSAFVPGQGYVALSRVRTLSGLYLAGYNEVALAVDETVQSQDEEFRASSAEAEKYFDTVDNKEFSTMQENFVRAMGGKWPRKIEHGRKKARRRENKSLDDENTVWSVERIRQTHKNAYKPWAEGEEVLLLQYQQAGKKTKEIAELLGRQPGAIRARLEKIAEREH